MLAVSLLAAVTNGGYGAQIMLLGLGILLGMLLLAVGELSVLGYLKFRELRQLWCSSKPAPEPAAAALPDPLPPAASRPPVMHQPRLRVVTPPAPAASRNSPASNARATLRRNAGYTDADLSA